MIIEKDITDPWFINQLVVKTAEGKVVGYVARISIDSVETSSHPEINLQLRLISGSTYPDIENLFSPTGPPSSEPLPFIPETIIEHRRLT